jgi:hypothetical protein
MDVGHRPNHVKILFLISIVPLYFLLALYSLSRISTSPMTNKALYIQLYTYPKLNTRIFQKL